MSTIPAALKYDSHHGSWRPFRGDLPGQSRRLDTKAASLPFGAGFTRIERDCELQLDLASDQVVYVISGEVRVTQPETAAVVVRAGEVLMLRSGTSLAIAIVGHCHFFYVLAPDMDWRSSLSSIPGAFNPITGDNSW